MFCEFVVIVSMWLNIVCVCVVLWNYVMCVGFSVLLYCDDVVFDG